MYVKNRRGDNVYYKPDYDRDNLGRPRYKKY